MEIRYYKVAGHVFRVCCETESFSLLTNYEPFGCDEAAVAFSLTISRGIPVGYAEEWRQEDDGQEIICGKTADGEPVFGFLWHQVTAGWYVHPTIVTVGLSRQVTTRSWPSIML